MCTANRKPLNSITRMDGYDRTGENMRGYPQNVHNIREAFHCQCVSFISIFHVSARKKNPVNDFRSVCVLTESASDEQCLQYRLGKKSFKSLWESFQWMFTSCLMVMVLSHCKALHIKNMQIMKLFVFTFFAQPSTAPLIWMLCHCLIDSAKCGI